MKNQLVHIECQKLSVGEYISQLATCIGCQGDYETKKEELDSFKLLPKQALYSIDYSLGEMTYTRGVKELLGYSHKEFNELLCFDHLYHPKQKAILKLIVKAAIRQGFSNQIPSDARMTIVYKLKHKNGKYITILRQTGILQKDKEGKMISSYSLITDVTDVVVSDKVEWDLIGVSEDIERLKKQIENASQMFFTKRELQVIKLLNKGLSSQDIAEKLVISKHTVDTHRRKTLKKSGCKNLMELINFVKTNNIL